MDVSGQLQAPAAQGNKPGTHCIAAGSDPEAKAKNLCRPCQESNTGCLARSLVSVLSYPTLQISLMLNINISTFNTAPVITSYILSGGKKRLLSFNKYAACKCT
jgi:hypothetical protein